MLLHKKHKSTQAYKHTQLRRIQIVSAIRYQEKVLDNITHKPQRSIPQETSTLHMMNREENYQKKKKKDELILELTMTPASMTRPIILSRTIEPSRMFTVSSSEIQVSLRIGGMIVRTSYDKVMEFIVII